MPRKLKKLAKTPEKWYIFLMLKALLKYVFIGFLVWFVLTKTGLRIKSGEDGKLAQDAHLPKSEYAPQCLDMIKSANYDKAAACYRHELIGNAANPEIRYYLAASMLAEKDFEGAKFHSEFILKNLSDSAYAPFARKIFDAAITSLSDKENLENAAGDDYTADLDSIHPWRKMPIKVWIQHSNNNANLQGAFSMWQTALYPTISFKMVPSKAEGNILVIFDDPSIQCSSEFAIGCTSPYSWSNDKEHTAGAVIRLTSHYPDGKRISDNQLFAVLAHEIGHALGMAGHSKNKSDIMYPDTSNYSVRLSRRDINTVRRIYGKR